MKNNHNPFERTTGAFVQPMTTYSIAAWDRETGETGVGVQSKYLAVGALVPWVRPGVGAAASQAATNSILGEKALDLLAQGRRPDEAVARLIAEDPGAARRQLGVVDASGRSAVHTGSECLPHAGQITGPGFCCQGNCLAGPWVLDRMAEAFKQGDGDLVQRLLGALTAAEAAGGDIRGSQSAALLVASPQKNLYAGSTALTDLRVDDHPAPVQELDRLLQLHRLYYSSNYIDRQYPFGPHLRSACAAWMDRLGRDVPEGDGRELGKVLFDFAQKRLAHQPEVPLKETAGGWIGGAVIHQLALAYFEWEASELR